MDLWVRSQDRERLMKVNGFDYVDFNDEYVINGFGTNECDNYDLGIYPSKERALEVLDEIQGRITSNERLITMLPIANNINGYEEKFGELFKEMVYEMPKE